jgi:hypothetical protein
MKTQLPEKLSAFIVIIIMFSFPVLYAQQSNVFFKNKENKKWDQSIINNTVSQISPSPIIQIKKVNPNMIRKLSSPLSSNYKNEFIQKFSNKNRKATANLLSEKNNSLSNSITREQQNSAICSPVLSTNFEGNPLTPFYLPPVGYYASECNIAISNAGKIVSISNGWINYYNEKGKLVFSDSLYDFCNGLIDVRLTYDSKKDRFVFIAAYGITDYISIFQGFGTVIAFSKTNDPMDGWNFYYIPYTNYNDKSSGDYQQLGISDNEAFITLLYNSNSSPKIKHVEIIQIDKNAGYAGTASLNSQTFVAPLTDAVKGSMVPAQGGSTTYGPNIYFIMGNELSNSSNKYNVYEITNTIASGHAVLNKYGAVTSNISFSGAGASYQLGGIQLVDINASIDDFVQNAFYENGVLQFCQNTNVNGKAAVYHGRISGIPNNMSCSAKTISDPNLYLQFPSIAYAGNSSSDNSAIIGIEHTGLNTYPGLSAVYVKSNFELSPLTTVKTGNDTINALWGDYSGICRRYNHPGEVWFEGQYGSSTPKRINWIAKLLKPSDCLLTIASEKNQTEKLNISLMVYPNPFTNSTTISFTLTQSQKISLKIYDMNGVLVKTLADELFEEGQHQLQWNTTEAKAGIYILQFDTRDYKETKKLYVIK